MRYGAATMHLAKPPLPQLCTSATASPASCGTACAEAAVTSGLLPACLLHSRIPNSQSSILRYGSCIGSGHIRSPSCLFASHSRIPNSSSVLKNDGISGPIATRCAPIILAQSIIMSGPSSDPATSASARISRPSASLFELRVVFPFLAVSKSPRLKLTRKLEQ